MTSARPLPATRDAVVKIARELMQRRSYLGFSFQDIADRIGIRKPSLYHHFASKEALGIEVLQQTAASFARWAATTPPAPRDKLSAYFAMYRQNLKAGQGVCPAGALAPGWDCIDSSLKTAVGAVRRAQMEWLETFTGELGTRGSSPAQLAAHLFALCQGALISARMTGTAEDFDAAVQITCRTLTDSNFSAGDL